MNHAACCVLCAGPSVCVNVPTMLLLLAVALQIEAGKEKELGNKAFAAKDYATAIQHFTKCIQLDPK